MLTEVLKKRFLNLYITDMAPFDPIKLLCLKKIPTLHSVKISSSANTPLLFAIVF